MKNTAKPQKTPLEYLLQTLQWSNTKRKRFCKNLLQVLQWSNTKRKRFHNFTPGTPMEYGKKKTKPSIKQTLLLQALHTLLHYNIILYIKNIYSRGLYIEGGGVPGVNFRPENLPC